MTGKLLAIVNRIIQEHDTRDPFEIAYERGAIILFVPLVKVNGFYQRYKDQDIIYLNEELTNEEALIVCAHELGHMILHRNLNKNVNKNHFFLESDFVKTSKYELEADIFAFYLLESNIKVTDKLPLVNRILNNASVKNI